MRLSDVRPRGRRLRLQTLLDFETIRHAVLGLLSRTDSTSNLNMNVPIQQVFDKRSGQTYASNLPPFSTDWVSLVTRELICEGPRSEGRVQFGVLFLEDSELWIPNVVRCVRLNNYLLRRGNTVHLTFENVESLSSIASSRKSTPNCTRPSTSDLGRSTPESPRIPNPSRTGGRFDA